MSNHLSVSDNERVVRRAKPSFSAESGQHLSDGDGAHIPVATRSFPHCDWCAAVDAYMANQHLERQMAEWALTRREQAEERKS